MDENLQQGIKNLCATAIEYGANEGKTFDFSAQSIADLEQILEGWSNDLRVDQPTENQIWSVAMIFGSYLGETLLKNGLSAKGFSWGLLEDSYIPVLLRNDSCYTTPVDKVFKRLVNGSIDNVFSFYRSALQQPW